MTSTEWLPGNETLISCLNRCPIQRTLACYFWITFFFTLNNKARFILNLSTRSRILQSDNRSLWFDLCTYFLYRLFHGEIAPYSTSHIITVPCRIHRIVIRYKNKVNYFDYFIVIDDRLRDRLDEASMNAAERCYACRARTIRSAGMAILILHVILSLLALFVHKICKLLFILSDIPSRQLSTYLPFICMTGSRCYRSVIWWYDSSNVGCSLSWKSW